MFPDFEVDYAVSKMANFKQSEELKIYEMTIYDFFKKVCFKKFSDYVLEEYSRRKPASQK